MCLNAVVDQASAKTRLQGPQPRRRLRSRPTSPRKTEHQVQEVEKIGDDHRAWVGRMEADGKEGKRSEHDPSTGFVGRAGEGDGKTGRRKYIKGRGKAADTRLGSLMVERRPLKEAAVKLEDRIAKPETGMAPSEESSQEGVEARSAKKAWRPERRPLKEAAGRRQGTRAVRPEDVMELFEECSQKGHQGRRRGKSDDEDGALLRKAPERRRRDRLEATMSLIVLDACSIKYLAPQIW